MDVNAAREIGAGVEIPEVVELRFGRSTLVWVSAMKFPNFRKPNLSTHMPESFSVGGFWAVARKLSKRGGRKVLSAGLTLFYCLKDSETPAWAKSVIVGALGYLIFPLDLIPDAILGAGFTDDWGVILGAMATVMTHIKEEHKLKAEEMAGRFFGGKSQDDAIEIEVSEIPR